MSNFEISFTKVLKNEGGYNNIAQDRGGATKYGVSLKAYKEFNPLATQETIKGLTVEDAKSFYKSMYWDKSNIEGIKDVGLSTKCFDIIINTGVKQGSKLIQRSVGAKEDGIIGDITTDLLNTKCAKSKDDLLKNICKVQQEFYLSIVAKNPEQTVFLKGWLARAGKVY